MAEYFDESPIVKEGMDYLEYGIGFGALFIAAAAVGNRLNMPLLKNAARLGAFASGVLVFKGYQDIYLALEVDDKQRTTEAGVIAGLARLREERILEDAA